MIYNFRDGAPAACPGTARFLIPQNSALDIPKVILFQPRRFEDKFDRYVKHPEREVEMVGLIAGLYNLNQEYDITEIVSPHRSLKDQHERAVIRLLQEMEDVVKKTHEYFPLPVGSVQTW